MSGSGCGKNRAVEIIIEFLRDVARQFDMLFLVFADRHMRCAIEQNIRRHKVWINIKPDGCFFAVFAGLFLKLRHSVQPAHARHAIQHPGQLGMFGHLRLIENNMPVRVDARGNKCGGNFARIVAQFGRVLKHGNGVQIDHAIEAWMRILQGHEIFNRAQIIAQMQVSRRLNSGKHPCGM